ncbi:MAG: polysaccharide deacetylase family protein [Armatimonadetes bacterium]|nr:polysaccharide deacetylase family protein [Armatimonadota bacterium]
MVALTIAAFLWTTPNPTGPGISLQVPKRFLGKIVLNKPHGIKDKVIAITYDDGPDPKNTPRVLELYKKYKGKTTFFTIGSYVKRHPDVVTKCVEAGHAVGSHTWTHPAKPTKERAPQELNWTAEHLEPEIGGKPVLFRPPYGIQKNWTTKLALQQKYAVILWNKSGADTARGCNANSITYNVLRSAAPGDIVLLHDGPGKKATIDATARFLPALAKKGYKFITVPEMLEVWDKQIQANAEAAQKAKAAKASKKGVAGTIKQPVSAKKVGTKKP